MILLRKILHNSKSLYLIKPLVSITCHLHYNMSNNIIDRKQIEQIHSQLITSPHKFNTSILVKLLYFVHFNSLNLQTNSIIKQDQLEVIINKLDIVRLSHQSLVMLLEAISQFSKYSTFNRDLQIMKLIYKRIYSIRKQIQPKLYYRLLKVMQKMQFPNSLIIRYVQIVNQDIKTAQQLDNENIPRMTRIDYIRYFITILEMNFIPIKMVDIFYEKEIQRVQFQRPKQLAHLYYVCISLDKSIKQKIKETQKKIDMRQMLFNPFSSIVSQQTSQKQQQQTKLDKQRVMQQKQTVINMCQQFKNKIKNKINTQKLKQQLCKLYSFEKQPLDTSTALILINIPEIIPSIFEYFKKNYTKMQPFEFGGLLQSVPQSQRIKYYGQYADRIWKILNLLQKLYMINIKAERCRQIITKQEIQNLIKQSQSISLKQFNHLSIAIVKYIKAEHHLELLRNIQALVDGDKK